MGPKLKLPRGSCDAHFHVFGPKGVFPYAEERGYTPAADAPKEALFALHQRLGIERGVVVQSAVHGFDNSAAADLLAARPLAYRGVALLATGTPKKELRRLHEQGFRGVRFHFLKHMGKPAPIGEVLAMAKRLADLGWHLQIHAEGTRIEELAPALRRSPVPVVIDHMGRIDASLGLDQPAFKTLRRLMEDKKIWIKVSGSERISRRPSPWPDAVPFARKLVEEFHDRTLWGTDWPHPNLETIPDDGVLVDLVAEIAPSEVQRRALLVGNPQRFYGFAAS